MLEPRKNINTAPNTAVDMRVFVPMVHAVNYFARGYDVDGGFIQKSPAMVGILGTLEPLKRPPAAPVLLLLKTTTKLLRLSVLYRQVLLMGYYFDFPDIAASRIAVEQLNDACKRMKKAWIGIVYKWTYVYPPSDGVLPYFSFLREFLKEDSGAEIFYFFTPPESTENMARRLCAALRLVSETIHEEEKLKIDSAQQLYQKTLWSAHCSKAGGRAKRKAEMEGRHYRDRHDTIDVKWIESITGLVDELCDEVINRTM
jgi:hypothetical protein